MYWLILYLLVNLMCYVILNKLYKLEFNQYFKSVILKAWSSQQHSITRELRNAKSTCTAELWTWILEARPSSLFYRGFQMILRQLKFLNYCCRGKTKAHFDVILK